MIEALKKFSRKENEQIEMEIKETLDNIKKVFNFYYWEFFCLNKIMLLVITKFIYLFIY
jgi:hypothetical protein